MRERRALRLRPIDESSESLARCAALLRYGVTEDELAERPLRWTLASSTRTKTLI